MLLKSITPQYLGPFCGNSTLYIEPDVTVITGPNDVGKSFALRAIELLCSQNTIEAHEVNSDRIRDFPRTWQEDDQLICEAEFETTEQTKSRKTPVSKMSTGTKFKVRRRLTSSEGEIVEISGKLDDTRSQKTLNPTPNVLRLPLNSEIHEEIDLSNMSDPERHLIRIAFGEAFSFEQLSPLSLAERSLRVQDASDRLNQRFHQTLPSSLSLRLMLSGFADRPKFVALGLRDRHGGFTAVGSRGSGVRRILNVIGALLRIGETDQPTIILYDEPETSLHADAQHFLRRLLESVASRPNIQVVYTTHSPSMVNTLRPHAIRIVERKKTNERAISEFNNNVFRENYATVRSSLGLSPADSLLYAPITVVVEGPTEIGCIPTVLQKLSRSGQVDSNALDVLLSQTHFLDGQGDSQEYMCRLAKSQNSRPILFVDGDKQRKLPSFTKLHPDVPVIALGENSEFENLVECCEYFKALANVLEDSSLDLREEIFRSWEVSAQMKPSVMLSKRIERWLRDVHDREYNKIRTMRIAVENATIEQITVAPFVQLFNAMQQVGKSL